MYNDGSYRLLNDAELKIAADACMNVPGVNVINVDRVRRVGDRLREELNLRKQRAGEHYEIDIATPIDSPAVQIGSDGDGTWSEQRLQQLISDGIEENHELEYKAAAALRREATTEITKDVSAFANSTGGTLIYGIAEFSDRRHLPERIDPISRAQISREWLEHVTRGVRPRIAELRITPVPLSHSSDSVAYVLQIPQGATAHQASDCRYYRRYNFEATMMLDHEVRDVMNRKGQPRLRIVARLVFFKLPSEDGLHGNLIFHIHNDSDVFVRYLGLMVETPLRFRGRLVAFEDGTVLRDFKGGWHLGYSNHSGPPLFPRAHLTRHFRFRFIDRFTLPLPPNEISDVRYVAYADTMQPVRGEIDLSTLESVRE
jgi:hypothetical protein